jgi:hypothetical protein
VQGEIHINALPYPKGEQEAGQHGRRWRGISRRVRRKEKKIRKDEREDSSFGQKSAN